MMLNLMLLTAVLTPPSNALFLDRRPANAGPEVEVWTNRDNDVYHRGDRVRVYFRASESGYVTIFRIDTDGRVRVLFPREPWEDNYARAGQRYEVRSYGDRYAFTVDDYPGQGYVFAVGSLDPFSYGTLVRGDHWDYRMIAEGGRVTGDPYVALTDLVDRIIPANYSEYSYDVQPYFVEQHYQYPRFLCYDCHTYASYTYWNPYAYDCFRFRIVVYNDFYYYPRRYYRGQRVIYRTAPRLAPRYVFKDRGPSDQWITTVRERPVDQAGRRVLDPGVRGRDLGATGRVPTPVITERRRPSTSSGSGDVLSAPDRRRTTDNGGNTAGQAPDTRRPDAVSPNDRPARRPDTGNAGQAESGRRPENIVPRAPDQDVRQQPQLERRDPRREGESSTPDARRTPSEPPRREPAVNEGSRPPRVTQPSREPERPRAEPRQPAARPQPAAEPERRAEPRSAPQRAPAEKPEDKSNEESGRRRPSR